MAMKSVDLRSARARAPGEIVRTRLGDVHVVVEGNGPPVVLVHGVTESALTFTELSASIAHFATVHAIDLPGHGFSDFPREVASLEEMSRWVDAYMESAGLERTVVVGWSMGGGVALELAIRFPERVGALVLLGTIGAVMPMPFSLGLLRWHGVGELMVRLVESPTFRRELLRDTAHASFTRHEAAIDRYWDAWNVRGRVRYLRRLLRTLDVAPLEARLGRVSAKAILVHGEQDRLVPISVARTIAAKIPGSELRELRHTGHSPHLEEPAAVRGAIRDAIAFARDATEIENRSA
jgi:4,5:9,10-diseco-3-hydroxy-5,9,17-trioxoandrosta-1(10),2-diene-4-oate hydrolase